MENLWVFKGVKIELWLEQGKRLKISAQLPDNLPILGLKKPLSLLSVAKQKCWYFSTEMVMLISQAVCIGDTGDKKILCSRWQSILSGEVPMANGQTVHKLFWNFCRISCPMCNITAFSGSFNLASTPWSPITTQPHCSSLIAKVSILWYRDG